MVLMASSTAVVNNHLMASSCRLPHQLALRPLYRLQLPNGFASKNTLGMEHFEERWSPTSPLQCVEFFKLQSGLVRVHPFFSGFSYKLQHSALVPSTTQLLLDSGGPTQCSGTVLIDCPARALHTSEAALPHGSFSERQ